ncbi:hypothetical protein PEPS_45830 (plasmid) [Persicobacter psychrovividus]|uniref:Uncharacterized protein n=1 Tax=Persicobacter psychrovividus TaxID=387638 RepID=A0ABN6LGM4_9BACT|nr:hypothetical protein PEPS_45830 [Persicobacter psychrovividus]
MSNCNFLNLPQKVIINGEEITYLYDAAGNKLQFSNPDGSTDYVAGIHYEDGALALVQHREGKYDLKGGKYFYNLTDHLGNVRQVLNKDGVVQQSTDYFHSDSWLIKMGMLEVLINTCITTRNCRILQDGMTMVRGCMMRGLVDFIPKIGSQRNI